MRSHEPFGPGDLLDLDGFLRRGRVLAMEDIYYGIGAGAEDVIAMRHDCDNVIEPAVHMARWEAERFYRSTYYILHTAPYWKTPELEVALDLIASYGHEIGIHNDAITVQLETGQPAAEVLEEAIAELRGYGHEVRSTVAHGNARCHRDRYVNDELFAECRRGEYGDIERLGVYQVALKDLGLDFDANWLSRGDYLSDSGGQWSQPFETIERIWPIRGQLHMLIHPDWWPQAFQAERAAA